MKKNVFCTKESEIFRLAAPALRCLVTAVALVLAVGVSDSRAQEAAADSSEEWDVTEPRGTTRTIDFTTSQGTWMSVDVSPDGEWVVFDLMEHIYRMPVDGGEAESLTQNSGLAVNFHARYSPDGRHIAFVSDRNGQENLWVMDADGSDPQPVFEDKYVQVRTPVWTPDGDYVIVQRRDVGPDRSFGGGSLWMYHRDGGDGIELVGSDDGTPSWPSVSGDGAYLYYHVGVGFGGEPLSGDLQLRRYDFETGEILEVTSGNAEGPALARHSSGGAFAPEVSPDGRRLTFGRKVLDGTISYEGHEFGPRTALWIRDLDTGDERKVMDPISVATRRGRTILPGYDWTPDGEAILISQGGLIRRLDPESGEVTPVRFEARVHRIISERSAASFRITDEPFQPNFLRWHNASPDGSRLAFQAVGRVWITERSGGTPRRVTSGSGRDQAEFAPSWSPDGRFLAYTTLDASNQGHVWKVPVDGGEPRRLTERPAFYTNLDWSADANHVVAIRGGGVTARGRTVSQTAYFEVVRIPADGGAAEQVATISKPRDAELSEFGRRAVPMASYGPEGRIFFTNPTTVGEGAEDGDSDESATALVSVAPDGEGRKVHMTFPYADVVVPSPEGGHVAFDEGGNVYVVPFPSHWAGAEPPHVEKTDGDLPVTRLTERGGLFPSWQNETTLEYGNAKWHYTYDVDTKEKDSVRVEFTVPTHLGEGTLALVGGRVITMNPDGPRVIERGTVVAEDGRIRCVGEEGECDASGADHTIDATGKTLMPGIIDMHSHHYRENRGHRPPNDYEVATYLAYGVTTSLDNSMWSQNIFPTAERIKAGHLIGPRTFSTGDPIYQGDGPAQNRIESYEDAENNVLRLKNWGAVAIKQYSHPRRDQRQWIIDAGRRAGLMMTGHWNPGVIMDGHTGFEHALEYVPLYEDITTFYGRAEAVYSPTMVVSGPGPSNLEYYIARSDVWRHDKQMQWMPWRLLTFLRWRPLRPKSDYSFPLVAQGMKEIIDAGGSGVVGAHGEHHALTPHWETWMAAEALGPMGALEVATLRGARFLGAERDLGSIQEGKLADLLVLNANPLDDIENTLDIQYVIQGGTVYDGNTLDEAWPEQKPFGTYYWLEPDVRPNDTRPVHPSGNP